MYLICNLENRHRLRFQVDGTDSAWRGSGGVITTICARDRLENEGGWPPGKDITGHTTEATAERIYDRRTAKRAKAVE